MGSAAEAKVAALHLNAQEAIPLRICLEELGHQQPATIIRTDNQTAKGFVRNTIKQKRSRTFDRHFWWLKDRCAQLQFNIIWDPGKHNLADYYTKHHPGSHHKRVRPIYLFEEGSPSTLQGCIKLMDKQSKIKVQCVNYVYTLPVTKTTVSDQRCPINEGISSISSYIKLLSKLILN